MQAGEVELVEGRDAVTRVEERHQVHPVAVEAEEPQAELAGEEHRTVAAERDALAADVVDGCIMEFIILVILILLMFTCVLSENMPVHLML